jgi:sulfoxide reductase heme-binding subunit YedZ
VTIAKPKKKKRDPALFVKAVVFVNGLVPLAFMLWDARHDQLGANPVDHVTRATGTTTLLFLVLTLAVTPLRTITGWGTLNKLRRMIGLFAFFYATLHLATYVWWDQGLELRAIFDDVWKRTFIAVGMAAWIVMVPLAITSTNGMTRRLGGKRWKLLHRLTYVAAILGGVHFVLLVKADTTRPVRYGIWIGVLLGFRVAVWAYQRWFKKRR